MTDDLPATAPIAHGNSDASSPFLGTGIDLGGLIARPHAKQLAVSLTQLWTLTMSTPLADLAGDLELLRRWFDPVAQGSRLRRDLQRLPAPASTWQDPGPPLSLTAPDNKRLLTPEGRCALEILSQSLSGSVAYDLFVADEPVRDVERLLLNTYRRWSRHRLDNVIDLLEGASKPLQISASGVVLTLLINRCTSRERALTRFASGPGREVIDEAFFAAVNAFSTTLNTRTRGNPANARLISGWMLYEAGRRLGDALVIEDARRGQDGAVWVVEDDTPHVLDVVARDLSRGRRGRIVVNTLAAAFDALVEALRQHLPGLAGFGLSHERPLATASLRRELLDAFERANAE